MPDHLRSIHRVRNPRCEDVIASVVRLAIETHQSTDDVIAGARHSHCGYHCRRLRSIALALSQSQAIRLGSRSSRMLAPHSPVADYGFLDRRRSPLPMPDHLRSIHRVRNPRCEDVIASVVSTNRPTMSQQGLDTAIADTTVDEDTIVPAERLQGFLLLLRVYTALARSSLGGHGYVSRFVSALRLSLYAVVLRSSTDNSRDKPNEFRAARTSFVPGLGLDYTPRLVVSCRVRPSRLCRPSPAPSVLVVETRNKEPNRDVRHLGFAAMRPELATDLKRAEGGLQLSTGNISDSSQRYPHSGESSWLLLFWVFLAGRWWRRTSFSGNG